jgi:hypothetical protein
MAVFPCREKIDASGIATMCGFDFEGKQALSQYSLSTKKCQDGPQDLLRFNPMLG